MTDKNRAREQASAQLARIQEMAKAYKDAESDEDRERAEQSIMEDPLSVDIRTGWHSPGGDFEEEFRILLCTGGPAVQIVGELNQWHEPENARLQYQDWFTAWEDYLLDSEEEAALVRYCQFFYFGE